MGSKWCFVVTMWCNITPSRASHDAKRRFWYGRSMFHKLMEPLNLSFCMNFLKISNEIGRAWCKHHLACDCSPLCQIQGHLNNARLIHGSQVDNWGWWTWPTHIVPQLWESIGRERLFLHVYFFNGKYLTKICHKWRFQKISSNFELVMNF